MAATDGISLLRGVANHIVLPPDLPGTVDANLAEINQDLLLRVKDASCELKALTNGLFEKELDLLNTSLDHCQKIHHALHLDKCELQRTFRALKKGEILPIHVYKQNAGLLVWHGTSDMSSHVIFEAFEVSAEAEKVLQCQSALQWDFPTSSAAIPHETFIAESFEQALAEFLEKSSHESVKQFASVVLKAGSFTHEPRDTPDPALITAMLNSLLEAMGQQFETRAIRKRVRDEVRREKGIPWRRSPFWLLLRVGILRHFEQSNSPPISNAIYKMLICLVHSRLLSQAASSLSPHLSHLILRKLGRRIAKLEKDVLQTKPTGDRSSDALISLLVMLRPVFQNAMDGAKGRLRTFNLALQTAQIILGRHKSSLLPESASRVHMKFQPALLQFFQKYTDLAEDESRLLASNGSIAEINQPWDDSVVQLAEQMKTYLLNSQHSYAIGTENRSRMILTIMWLWSLMDKLLCQHMPEFSRFKPIFGPRSVDCLRLSSYDDLCRLKQVQAYLAQRHSRGGSATSLRTVFDIPRSGCFADRHCGTLPSDSTPYILARTIQEVEEENEAGKKVEWEGKDAEHKQIMKEMPTLCQYSFTGPQLVLDHDDACHKCILTAKADRIRIHRIEKAMPEDDGEAKAVLFELTCPPAYSVYRDATWAVVADLALPGLKETTKKPVTLAHSYYRNFCTDAGMNSRAAGRMILASRTKSSLQSHFHADKFPIRWEDVIVNNGLKFEYYDCSHNVWPAEHLHEVTFDHHCMIQLLRNSALSKIAFPEGVLPNEKETAFIESKEGLGGSSTVRYLNARAEITSNEILAALPRCPRSLGLAEFVAFQTLFSGSNRMWQSFLVEMGSSNLNFSLGAVTTLSKALIGKTGPSNGNSFNVANMAFQDEAFCQALLDQIERRLSAISSNSREYLCMETLLSLILKLLNMGSGDVFTKASALLEVGRSITLEWIRLLREEIWGLTNSSGPNRLDRIIFWAALLCRRTFTMFSDEIDGVPTSKHQHTDEILIPSSALAMFLEASITLQEYRPADLGTPLLTDSVVRDVKMAARLKSQLKRSLQESAESLVIAAIQANVMSIEATSSRPRPRSVSFHEKSSQLWARVELPHTKHLNAQTIDFCFLSGTLLLNGRSIERKLPLEIRNSAATARLFSNQVDRLAVYPSYLAGMTYKLAFNVEGNEIHFGFRNEVTVIWARSLFNGSVLEYVPESIFVGKRINDRSSADDLPAPLINNSVHWLDLQKNIIEVRKITKLWRPAPANWRIDLNRRIAQRRNSTLIDPGSGLAQQFASIFHGFEDPRYITVFQQYRRALRVELRRFELNFFVNANRLLECTELHAEIDQNQDAGTWYGLSSKIVLRDSQNPKCRSIIVPLGRLVRCPRGIHVDVQVRSDDPVYARSFMDDVLGRLTCASEPRLFYTKALLHACTSFCLPDSLTGRTGADEACQILNSGSSQPYSPLTPPNKALLDSIAKLAPVRRFYPPGTQDLEMVSWDKALTVSIQDDRFRPLVEDIKRTSDQLARFDLKTNSVLDDEEQQQLWHVQVLDYSDDHLAQRSRMRRDLYELPRMSTWSSLVSRNTSDVTYSCRGYRDYKLNQENVFQVTRMIGDWPERLPSPRFLDLVFEGYPFIAGYGDGSIEFDGVRLSDCLDVDLASSWGPLVNLYRTKGSEARHGLIFLTALICFRESLNAGAIYILTAFAIFEDLKKLDLPSWPSYTQFRTGFYPKVEYIRKLLLPFGRPFDSAYMPSRTQKQRKAIEYARSSHELRVEECLDALSEFMCGQWPCPQPNVENFSSPELDIDIASSRVVVAWNTMYQHYEFEEHLRQVGDVLSERRCPPAAERRDQNPRTNTIAAARGFPLLLPLMSQQELPVASQYSETVQQSNSGLLGENTNNASNDIWELKRIVRELPTSKSVVRREYRRGLLESISALEKYRARPTQQVGRIESTDIDLLIAYEDTAVKSRFVKLIETSKANEPGAHWLDVAGLWPVRTYSSLLEMLRSTSSLPLTESMRAAIVEFGVTITHLQRLLRIRDAFGRGKGPQVEEELKNRAHTNWNPEKYPAWLLFEIDANILIRPIQVDVALATINPASGSNSVLQLNMGQGKTSTIIPLVASILANGKSLCRVVVPKALLLQTAQLLQLRLGGLLGRELRHVPFSRRTPSSLYHIKAYADIHESIRRRSGVIITLPEHMMSFILSGQQRLLDDKLDEAKPMLELQSWLTRKSRDVFDECDFTMAVKTQLIYPSGPQVTVDGGSYRWEAIEAVLKLAESHLFVLERNYPSSIQIVRREIGGFPFIHFLRNDVQDALIQQIAADVCSGRTPLLNVEHYSLVKRRAIKKFITEPRPHKSITGQIADIHRSNQIDGYVIYLLRGLLVHRILILTLSRRWNVQYGLHPLRDPVAVPYLAKGIPSQLAEWGHVEVSLVLTCLSFYYQGLSMEQLKQSLEQVLKSDDPAREYEQWTQGAVSLSDQYRDWGSINLEDAVQLRAIWAGIRYNIAAIDHFLNNFVFPKYAKQFKVKLQASGWDLPLAGEGRHLTTGFSGTNDNRLVLPSTIEQGDLKGLAHTNAEVLSYLLHPRNRFYCLAGFVDFEHDRPRYRRMGEQQLLKELCSQKIRILIDSGALILEMTNLAVAKMWLEIDTEAKVAIYFDENNKPTVLYRTDRKIPLLASPFAEDLSDCLVYLDESHTRGTDMKFPPNARGAVTLGLGQTKDHTVQAVMRLRQLATTQSITFFAPPEVHQSILDFRHKDHHSRLHSHDVIHWLLEQTCQSLENLQPLYYSQGLNYCRRTQAAIDCYRYLHVDRDRLAYIEGLRSPEQLSLRLLYEPQAEESRIHVRDERFDPKIKRHIDVLEDRRRTFQDTGNAVDASTLQEVEQEREMEIEVETVREKQQQLYFHPRNFGGLHERIRDFAMTGTLKFEGKMCEDGLCEEAFSYINRTATGLKYPADLPKTPQLLLSAEFRRAVVDPSGRPNDGFLRPVQWILWSMKTEMAILVSPEEAELLIPICRDVRGNVVHLLTYAAPTTQKMLHFNDLSYHAIPTLPASWSAPMWLKIQIGIFAGCFYFAYAELKHLCDFLGLHNFKNTQPERTQSADVDDTFLQDEDLEHVDQVMPGVRDTVAMDKKEEVLARAAKTKMTKMLKFLHAWLSTRSRGQDFTGTPMGYLCAQKPLTRDHPFFRKVDENLEALRMKAASNMTEGVLANPGAHVDEEHDNASDSGDDDVDEREKLTEEEMRQSEKMDTLKDDGVESRESSDGADEESGGSALMIDD